MNKEEAEMWADVARRLGLEDVYVEDEHGEGEVSTDATVYYTHEFAVGDGSTDRDWRDFDPPNNPTDERMLWDWLEAGEMGVDVVCGIGRIHDGVGFCSVEITRANLRHEAGCAPCRVTALGLAIQGLPV